MPRLIDQYMPLAITDLDQPEKFEHIEKLLSSHLELCQGRLDSLLAEQMSEVSVLILAMAALAREGEITNLALTPREVALFTVTLCPNNGWSLVTLIKPSYAAICKVQSL